MSTVACVLTFLVLVVVQVISEATDLCSNRDCICAKDTDTDLSTLHCNFDFHQVCGHFHFILYFCLGLVHESLVKCLKKYFKLDLRVAA